MDEKQLTPEIVSVLRSMELFQGKDSDELGEWLGKPPFEGGAECELRRFATGELIIEEGSFGNCLYLLIGGSAGVSKGPEGRPLARLGPGSFFGEMTLISGLPRTASVAALENCLTIEVPRRAFEAWMQKPGSFRNVMDRTYLERGLANHLQIIPEFADIAPGIFKELVKKARLRIFSKDDRIVREGDEADSLYIIRDGYVRVAKAMAGGEQRTVAYLNEGAYFGETSLIHAMRREATVWAMGKVEVIQILKEDFFALLNLDEGLLSRLRARQSKPQSGQYLVPELSAHQGFIGAVVERGVIKATSALVIHLNVCTRCGNCVKACAELHDGISRLTRHGMLFEAPPPPPKSIPERMMVATSCMHCLDPECMIGCPTGAITRDVNGEVVINDSCIGCGNCARRCPYGNISMADLPAETELEKQQTSASVLGAYLKFWRNPGHESTIPDTPEQPQKATVRRIAVKCDLCQAYNHNHGCVHNCPYSAIERIDAREYLNELQRGGG
ncbi:MAG TPA: cyclic nucleotide-binding domain-containing protein [Bryobacteraceae bacterium]|nr:cyclic nucleotide-binding domain-containing protein [Bryobacteraceae bacterium]